ncbi:TPA: TIGR02680 family protein [Bacillus cereus]|nr:TIGR02680 family protein [Bacillus cereus]HDR8329660.1 TIGR02680 family protein [Bacillus cereus]HDR8337042.1 TIGR02680 family protein [Bacillus cereus]
MSSTRWVMNRAGFCNFWYYDEEIFQFRDGKLLLRGNNGSGKSITMQSLLPVLLDGKKSPERLDPFGSKARRMEEYLLGEIEVNDRDERTGYIFMEYKKQGTNQYMTTGIGMQAKRNKGIKSWYFLLTDNRRIGHDFNVTQTHAGDKVPLSAKELENRIGQGGYVVYSQREYMDLVNKHVFGFQSSEAYEDLIKLLIQLRSPKLSKEFKPTVISEILESALPPLNDDELRHLSDTIENMDQTQQQLEQLDREANSISKVESVYDTYNHFILAERAEQWNRAENKSNSAANNVEHFKTQLVEIGNEIIQLKADEIAYEQQRRIAEQEKSSLQKHEVWSLEEEKSKKEAEAYSLSNEVTRLEGKLEEHNNKLHDLWKKRVDIEVILSARDQKVHELLKNLSVGAEDGAFKQHVVNMSDYERRAQTEEFDFTVWLREAKDHQMLLQALEKKAEEAKRLRKEHERLQRESSIKKSEFDERQKELDHLQEWFDSQHQQLEENVFRWIEEHPQLVYPREIHQEISRALQGLYEQNRFDEVRDKLSTVIQQFETDVKKDQVINNEKIEEKNNEISKTEEELHRIKTQKMVEPNRAKGTEMYRAQLKEKGKAFVPFYEAVEFLEHVTEEQRERIEVVLRKTGILDSLITNEIISPKDDSVLTPAPVLLGYTLADYLIPDLDKDSPITSELVDEVLRSISLEKTENNFRIDVDGTYSIGCLTGHVSSEGTPKFIGRMSRKRFQREQIQLWTEKLSKLQNEVESLHEMARMLEGHLYVIEEWKKEIPHDRDLIELHDQILSKKIEVKGAQELLRIIDADWKIVNEKLNRVNKELREQGSLLNISLTIENIHVASVAAGNYIEILHGFINGSLQVAHTKRELASSIERTGEIERDLDTIKCEQNIKESQVSEVKALIQSFEQQLQLNGVDEVRKRIIKVQNLLNESEEQLRNIRTSIPQKKVMEERYKEKLAELQVELAFWQHMQEEWKQMVEKEVERGFVDVKEVRPSSILTEYGAALTQHERAKLSENLSKIFFEEQSILTEYRMIQFTEEEQKPKWFNEGFGELYKPFMNEWEHLKGRRFIQLDYQGQRVSPYYVASALKKGLEEQKEWLNEQDRQLYEDIIVNTVGIILRNRIQRAQNWVKQMDKVMAERDNSSGLTFSIAWKPLTADSEQELDTKDLVKLLQRNSKFLNEEDLQRITKHFQSRIMKAKELIQLRNEGTTLQQVLKEVLDYRKWFTFVLSFVQENKPKRELTNNAFYKFSGGEIAMTMYLPLFIAAYSRYKEAGEMSPHIISLDEAFAGVDEKNIRDMFQVVEQLGFNYIMNSQALWGDYDIVPSLSIAEIVRPKNADFVTVIRYEWDGKFKSLVIEEDDDELVKELVHERSYSRV